MELTLWGENMTTISCPNDACNSNVKGECIEQSITLNGSSDEMTCEEYLPVSDIGPSYYEPDPPDR